jgi:hypothetical protein
MPEYGRAVICRVLTQDDADTAFSEQLGELSLSVNERERPQVVAVKLKQVERVQHGLSDGAVPVQSVEDRNAVRSAHNGLADDSERAGAQLGRRAGNRWITGSPSCNRRA